MLRGQHVGLSQRHAGCGGDTAPLPGCSGADGTWQGLPCLCEPVFSSCSVGTKAGNWLPGSPGARGLQQWSPLATPAVPGEGGSPATGSAQSRKWHLRTISHHRHHQQHLLEPSWWQSAPPHTHVMPSNKLPGQREAECGGQMAHRGPSADETEEAGLATPK